MKVFKNKSLKNFVIKFKKKYFITCMSKRFKNKSFEPCAIKRFKKKSFKTYAS